MDGSFIFNSFADLVPIAQAAANTAATAAPQVGGAGQVEPGINWPAIGTGAAFVLGIFVLPFVISHFITSAIRMPKHSFRLGVMLAAISAGLLFSWMNNFQLKLGADMKGGTNLVYDIVADEMGEKVQASSLASALAQRINPSGTKEITIRPRGESQIEIIVPNTDEFELQKIKDLLQNSGQLEFRIVANTRDHQDIIALARQQAAASVPQTDVVDEQGETVGRWFTVGREEDSTQGLYPLKTSIGNDIIRNSYTGELIDLPNLDLNKDKYAIERWLDSQGIPEIDLLMALEFAGEPYAYVAGEDLASATTGYDKLGQPVVNFRLNSTGAGKMTALTAVNTPIGNFHRRMAIIMDKKVLSAPQLNSPITSDGQITGNFTKAEVDFLVTILRSGRLPATLSPEPASETRVGAGLGATTIQKGTTASIWAVVATFVCILLYYRFSGVVASLALLINGLLIFGVMIFIGQPLTLPGLAGLVLTIGMSVDANVLIFERIREEKFKGSAPRMAIRNGFDRAFTTIIDSNLTTLIAAIVLYWIGTDQVRGFAVALIIGIATSMFTATFCSRIVFEIAEKMKFVNLSMADGVGFLKKTFLGEGELGFMKWQKACFAISSLLILIGIGAIFARGRDILNIDFTGGTSVTFQLQEAVPPEELREMTRSILTTDQDDKPVQSTLVRVEKPPMDTVYTLVTSIEDPDFLAQQLLDGFAKTKEASIVTYRVQYRPKSASGAWLPSGSATRFVSFQEPVDNANSVAPTAGEETTDAEADADDADMAVATPTMPNVFSEFELEFGGSNDDEATTEDAEKGAKVVGPELKERLVQAAANAGIEINAALIEIAPETKPGEPKPDKWRPDDAISGFSTWSVRLPLDQAAATKVLESLETQMTSQPKWLSLSKIGTRVADEMQQRAIAALLLSLLFIVAYIWFRFQKVAYGLAAVVALVHDVIITMGILAMCHWLAGPLSFLLIEDFKIGLTEVAAFLTIVGYSLNDTIVVFDRIREVRGRSPRLTEDMINSSVNQTLSRTLLTSGTTLLTVALLYIFGGDGIHAFSFALLVGILVGTYSSIFVASPVLLWISNREAAKHQQQRVGTAA